MTLDRERAAKACLSAAGAGGAVCGIQFLAITGGFTGTNAPIGTVIAGGLTVFLVTWLIAALAFLIGLQVVGPPAAAFLASRGQATPAAVVAAGALLSAGVAGTFGAIAGGASGATLSAAFLLLPGGLAGWVFHRVTWGRRATPP